MAYKNSNNRVFDYFLVSGISDDDSFLEELKLKAKSHQELCYKPSLLCRFPNDRKGNVWNEDTQDTLLRLCHPNNVLVTCEQPESRPQFHSFPSTRDDGFRFYGHVLTYFDIIDLDYKTSNYGTQTNDGEKIAYAQKCVCLITRFPFINTAQKVLSTLHQMFSSEIAGQSSMALPIESYLYNLLFDVAIPHPGQSVALKWNREDTIVIQQPYNNELPLLDIHLSTIFDLLDGPNNVLKLLTSAFLEQQILLVSEDCHKLILVAEAIQSLMFPFKWSHPYVPVLPFFELAKEFLEAPWPYIMGIPMKSSDEKLIRIRSEFAQCFVDIDNAIVDCPEGQPYFPDQTTLLQQLKAIHMSFKRGKESIIEEEEDEEECGSPVMRRRNAKKSNMKQHADKSEDVVAEDLRNLHAVATPNPAVVDMKYVRSNQKDIVQDLFNVDVRETIFGVWVSLMPQYDKFVILPECRETGKPESWHHAGDSQNFDKASFLSDQRESHLMFLSAFLETQAFASLIDSYILGMGNKCHSLSLLDGRINQAKTMLNPEKSPGPFTKGKTFELSSLNRSESIISAGRNAKESVKNWMKLSKSSVQKRHTGINGRYPVVTSLSDLTSQLHSETGKISYPHFPHIICPSILLENVNENAQESVETSMPVEKPKVMRQPSVSELSPDMIARTNWKFLERMLKDVKSKTNKLVVCKLGQDDYKRGHSHISLHGVEENTLIGSLCDLLERIWNHGLNPDQKRGKSALWSHLLRYEDDSVRIMRTPQVPVLRADRNMPGMGYATSTVISQVIPVEKSGDAAQTKSDKFEIQPIQCDLIGNIKRIKNLTEVKTNIGKCRAWIRLALEQKQLEAHLKKLLVNRPLLQTIYKRYSLLRCEDEREQFLHHLLALNTVDFSCFSNSFTKTVVEYRVWIFPKKQISGISQTTANVYIMISGDLSCTDIIAVPKNCNDFIFPHPNIGVLTTVLFGHDNSGLLPRWYVDHIIIRNELTGQAYYLPFGRSLGSAVEDGSTQRLLVAYNIPLKKDLNAFIQDIYSGSILTCSDRVPKDIGIQVLRDLIGQCVNDIVQHLMKNSPSPSCAGVLTSLLLKSNGLVALLIIFFENGLKSSGLFRKRHLAWDVIQAACAVLHGKGVEQERNVSYKKALINFVYNTPESSPKRVLSGRQEASEASHFDARQEGDFLDPCVEHEDVLPRKSSVARLLCALEAISSRSMQGLGKEDMFQLLICVGLRTHLLPEWIQRISEASHQTALYEKSAFMFNRDAVDSLCGILSSLSENSINFEPILWRGIDDLNTV